jgi:hypothetical protein
MPSATVARTWTIGTWLVTRLPVDAVADALVRIDADVIALQSVRRDVVERLADGLAVRHAWEISHYPRSRLLPGSAVGLAVLTRHSIGDSVSFVTNNHSSTWSRRRRIAHLAVIDRADHSGYTIGHAVGSPDPESRGTPPSPLVWFRPELVELDMERSVDLPDGARLVDIDTRTPVSNAAPLMTVTFEMPWVEGDLPVG